MTSHIETATPGLPTALVSIHDLMPSTMPAVRRLLRLLERTASQPLTLLVVPGRGWSQAATRELKVLEQAGHILAGHGWLHHIERFRNPYHWLHGLLLSRRVAEHLALDANAIIELINRCHAWFGDNGLNAPYLYVPPAWALGPISIERLAETCPFRLYETFTGILDADGRRMTRMALLGYEADALPRVPVLRGFNAINRRWAKSSGLLRIGIHPHDGELHLRRDLLSDLEHYRIIGDYASLYVGEKAQTGTI
ncbi:MAG: DUF2334 domain-containing protein [Thiohalocapsa sp. PB-PSB1]|jgi:predicted deacetylase|nr:MAG: DUF2334 domain-containing protein [Thiohalocapsa sp. PB-PSB1]HCS88766.1 DUF2334 domain-containing protein [Chromatiaceae bacterium]